VAVVALDQVVDLAEVPALRQLVPLAREVGAVLLAQRVVGLGELCLVQLDRDFDRPQATHPRERTAEGGELRSCVRTEVAQPPPERLAGKRVLLHVLVERFTLTPVARRLRTRHALTQNRLALAPFHAASVPAAMAEVEGQVINEELDAEQEARRQLALAQIRQYPDPVLKMEARPVEEFDDDLKRLVGRMRELMKDASGVGLAATQVGVLRRVFVFSPDEERVLTVVNPEIVSRGDEVCVDEEGCLSIQGLAVPVERSTVVRLEGQDEKGKRIAYELEGQGARVAQHELDHLNGTLILDRTTPEARREAMAALRPRLVLR
jgi:peptide deformylase